MNINVDDRDGDEYDAFDDVSDVDDEHGDHGDTAAHKVDERQALMGAMGKTKLTTREVEEGKLVLQHIRNELHAAAATQHEGSTGRRAAGAGTFRSRRAQSRHRQHRVKLDKQAQAAGEVRQVHKSHFSSTLPVVIEGTAGTGGRTYDTQQLDAPRKRRVSLHAGGAGKAPGGGAHDIVGKKTDKVHISVAQQLVDHLPHSVLKKLQAAENAAGVGAEGPGAGGEVTGWGEGAIPGGGQRKAAGGKPTRFKPMFDFNFDGFGMKLAGAVQTWQPGAAAWYAYVPPEEADDSMRRSSLDGDFSGARSSAAARSWLCTLASTLVVCLLVHGL